MRPDSRLAAWLQLLRAPNLLTAPGDPLAGALLAGAAAADGGRLALAAAGSLAVYAGGLVWNDIADLREDARERPSRPLPSKRISVAQAAFAAWMLPAAGLVCFFLASRAAGFCGLALILLVQAYDFGLKRTAAGPWAMGLCRGLSALCGALAVAPAIGWKPAAAAGVLTAYTACISYLARGETGAGPGRPVLIGRLIGGFLVWQAAFALTAGRSTLHVAAAAALLLLWFLNARLQRQFYAS